MKVRSLAVAICLLGSVAAFGQQTDTEIREGRIQSALATLRTQGSAFLQLQGTQTTGTTAVTLKTLAYWLTDSLVTPNVLKLEIRQYRNDKLVTRILGDGKTLWTYRNDRQEYSADPYGRWGTSDYPNYRKDLVDLMSSASGEEVTLVTRLLRETFAGDNALYRSWLPGVAPTDGDSDPYDVVYTLGDPARRTISFDIEMADSLELHGIDYYDLKKVGAANRETVWSIDVLDLAMVPAELNFVPYTTTEIAGWKPVVRARPGIQ